MKLKKNITLLIAFLLLSWGSNAQKNQLQQDAATSSWKYDLECYGGTARSGYKMVKVWTYSIKTNLATDQAKKNAVHGIIFKGFAGQQNTCKGSRPLMNKELTDTEYKEFFDTFFQDGGEFNRFVTNAADYNGIAEVQKLFRKKKGRRKKKFDKYKIGIVVTVATKELRKYLEKKNIIKSLSNGF